jgi:hypothetical protein
MNAKEARELTNKMKESIINKEYNTILECIKISINNGEYETYYYKTISNYVKDKFEKLGYEIVETYDRSDVLITIKW